MIVFDAVPMAATVGPDPIAVAALAISLLALVVGAVNAIVNVNNRRDKKSVSLLLVGNMVRTSESDGHFRIRAATQVWKLHNAGEAIITNPQIVVHDDASDMHFTGTGPLPGGGASLQVVPVGDYPEPDYREGGRLFWDGKSATVTWTKPNGKKATAPAIVSYSYV